MAQTLLNPEPYPNYGVPSVMKLRQRKILSLVVAEEGGDAEQWVRRLRDEGHEVVLMRQTHGESLKGLAARLRARCAIANDLGEVIDTAVIVGGGQVGQEAVSARSLAVRALTSSMVRARRGRVLLSGEGDDRFSMMALASAVSPMVRGAGIDVLSAAEHTTHPEPAAPAASRAA